MAQLAVAWVLQNDNVASAIIGASRPEQVDENVKASGVDARELLGRIDEVLGDVVERDPGRTAQNAPRPPPQLRPPGSALLQWAQAHRPRRPRSPSRRRVTCSTPSASSPRHDSPTHDSASAWLGKGTGSPEGCSGEASAASNRQL